MYIKKENPLKNSNQTHIFKRVSGIYLLSGVHGRIWSKVGFVKKNNANAKAITALDERERDTIYLFKGSLKNCHRPWQCLIREREGNLFPTIFCPL